MQKLAFDCLFKWLEVNPKYSHLAKNKPKESPNLASFSIVHMYYIHVIKFFKLQSILIYLRKDFIDLQETYLEAVRETANKIDPDLQVNLKISFY